MGLTDKELATCLWSWFRFELVMPSTVKETMFSWAFRRRKRICRAWDLDVVPLPFMWIIWRKRNRRALGVEKDFVHLGTAYYPLFLFGATIGFLHV